MNSFRDVINNCICVLQCEKGTLPICRKPTAVLKVRAFGKGRNIEQCVTHSLEAYSDGQQQGPHYMKWSHPKYVAH
jgi:uncharacterized protein YlaN (UPF0358 family)